MHLALKSAMSRIPYTNKVGETLVSIANSAAAYSLRALGGGDPMVARVRRSSDDTEKDFTASDVGAALEDWVNEDVVVTNGTFTNISGTYDTFSGASSSGFTATNTASDGRALSNATISTPQIGDKFRINYNLTLNSGSGITFSLASSTGASASNSINVNASGTGSIELTATKTDIASLRVNAIGNVDFVLSDVSITAIQSSGHVTTWYDQSGNDNHATQGTAGSQPKIVDGGVLVSDGIEFDGVDDYLGTSTFSLTQPYTTLSVSKSFINNDSGGLLSISTAPNGTTSLNSFYRNDNGIAINAGATLTTAPSFTYSTNTSYLKTSLFNGASSEISVNSISRASGNSGSIDPSGYLYLGNFSVYYLNGTISEIIIYNSDQSSNREAIETNINNHYDIY